MDHSSADSGQDQIGPDIAGRLPTPRGCGLRRNIETPDRVGRIGSLRRSHAERQCHSSATNADQDRRSKKHRILMRRTSVRFEPTVVSVSGGDERGVAMLVVLMVMLMMTVLGVAAITVSGLENKIAGLQRTTENAAQAAESCLGTSANVIMQTLLPENGDTIPAALLDTASPAGPVPSTNATILENEIIGNPENSPDSPVSGSENIRMPAGLMNLGGYTVLGDID